MRMANGMNDADVMKRRPRPRVERIPEGGFP
jgi:hypothetical protein